MGSELLLLLLLLLLAIVRRVTLRGGTEVVRRSERVF
jgi:hypothetical protein